MHHLPSSSTSEIQNSSLYLSFIALFAFFQNVSMAFPVFIYNINARYLISLQYIIPEIVPSPRTAQQLVSRFVFGNGPTIIPELIRKLYYNFFRLQQPNQLVYRVNTVFFSLRSGSRNYNTTPQFSSYEFLLNPSITYTNCLF